MILFFQIIVWVCIFALGFYVYYSWKWEEVNRKILLLIRKCWYIIFLLGAVIYWTGNPESIFFHWKNYLIIAVAFCLIDAFVFLSAYIKKVGNNELATDLGLVVNRNYELIKLYEQRLKSFSKYLKYESFTIYDGDEQIYIYGLQELLSKYGSTMKIMVKILSYNSIEDKKRLAEEIVDNKEFAEFSLARREVFYMKNEAYIPIQLLESSYIIRMKSSNEITEFDIELMTSMISIYELLQLSGEEEEWVDGNSNGDYQ